jgi:hypothetical protein
MTLNQVPYGAPAHSGNPLAPIASFVDSTLSKRRGIKNDMQFLAANNALSMMRQDAAHRNNKELQTQRIEATATENAANRAHKEKLQRGQHRYGMRTAQAGQAHEINLANVQSGNRIAELQATMKGIHGLGKSGRVGEFKMGDIHAKFNPYESSAPTAKQSPAPAAPEQPQSVATPAPVQTAKPSLMWNNPQTGRIEKRPEGAPAPIAKKAAAKKTAPRPRKK